LLEVVRLTPLVRRLRAELERLVREAQNPASAVGSQFTTPSSESLWEPGSRNAETSRHEKREREEDGFLRGDTIREHAGSSRDDAREVCPICLQAVVELSSYRDSRMCGNCVTLLRGH